MLVNDEDNVSKTSVFKKIIVVFLICIIIMLIVLIVLKIKNNSNTVSDKDNNRQKIDDILDTTGLKYFSSSNYSCKTGENLSIELLNSDNEVIYKSLDEKIATAVLNDTGLVISCISEGEIRIEAFKNNKSIDSVTIKVEKKDKETSESIFTFESSSYNCKVGEKKLIKINISSNIGVDSFLSNDKGIATIEDPSKLRKCPSCRFVELTCLKEGKTTLEATGTDGTKTKADITVEAN